MHWTAISLTLPIGWKISVCIRIFCVHLTAVKEHPAFLGEDSRQQTDSFSQWFKVHSRVDATEHLPLYRNQNVSELEATF